MTLRRSITSSSSGPVSRAYGADALAGEREFLMQSMEDLDEEHTRGEVDEVDFALLQSRYRDRLIEVEVALADLSAKDSMVPDPDPSHEVLALRAGRRRRWPASRRARLLTGIAAAGCFVIAAGLLAASLAGVRLPGESVTGSVSLSSAQQEQQTLDRAAVLGSEGQAAEAVQLYNQVLRTDPNQPNALAYGGWLVRLAGLSSKNELVVAKGDASVARAVRVAPGYPDAHALLGVILYQDFQRPRSAAIQFRDAVSAGASKSLLESVVPIATQAFSAAKQALPSSYVAAAKAVAASGTG